LKINENQILVKTGVNMAIAYAVLDTLNFVKKLEAVGVEPKVAEAQAELQMEILEKQAQVYNQVFKKYEEYQPVLDELKITKNELATKADIGRVESKIENIHVELDSKIENLRADLTAKIENMRNELIIKLGGIVVGSMTILGVVIAFLVK
jgi:hypothetical protein